MISTDFNIKDFIAGVFPFQNLPGDVLDNLIKKVSLLRYRMGQAIVTRSAMPQQVSIIYQGQVRLIGYDKRNDKPATLKLLQSGEILGWVSHVRGVACETAIASTEVICVNLAIADFLSLWKREKSVAIALENTPALVEVYDLLGEELCRQADGETDLLALCRDVFGGVVVEKKTANILPMLREEEGFLWLVSSDVRLLKVPCKLLSPKSVVSESVADVGSDNIPYAPDSHLDVQTQHVTSVRVQKFPYVRGRGPQDGLLACLQMLSQFFNIPFRRDVLRRVIEKQFQQNGSLSLKFCGAVGELMGLTTQLVKIPAIAISRLQPPVMIAWQDSFAILYKNDDRELWFAIPEMGLVRRKGAVFVEMWGSEGEVLLLQPANRTNSASTKPFGWSWFVPALKLHRKVLIEVLIASIVVQIFGLVNPLATQVIIDKVIIGNSPDTLEVLGIFLLAIALVEAVLSAIRTQLFVDTSNRIDLSLGSEVINHLLRLPLSYFERRPVGELATRISELEQIRSFLTGTALTVVMDAVFSVVYIIVMGIYSWILTVVALVTVPLFALVNLLVSPLMRRQLQEKAERHASTHSYLVEVMGGVQTVKAQNLELRSRWQWQERYARYISAGFKTISTQTTASSLSSFLNKLSSLLVLWVGAYLVLNQQLTLGQLIAFRIISGYVTSPLLRLVQSWQNFQETALSLQRLSDILDTPPETEVGERQNILMPSIVGSVRYENISFSFLNQGQLQLCNINLDLPAGSFVGIVGQSGSGKSTLLKLLPRLYEPKTGKILIDGYDISKVELYSLRRQIGVVLQDTLLFDGTVRENIALANPDASDEEIIAAALVAFAHDFIMSLPSGYNTNVGERGSALSGGQRQRVAIARTVLQNPQLLVLDEATSALDYNAEAEVCQNLATAFQGKTVFFITHRLSTIRNADVILMMEQGRVVEKGNHAELMSLKGYYYCLFQQQGSGE